MNLESNKLTRSTEGIFLVRHDFQSGRFYDFTKVRP